MSWVEYFVMAAALAAVVWTMKRNYFKKAIREYRSSKEKLNHTSASLQSIINNDSSENSTSVDTDYYTDNEYDEISADMSIEIKYKQTTNEKNATICSGYGSTGDNTQDSKQNTSNESNHIQDTSNSDLINSDSFGTNSYGNGQYSQIQGEFTKNDEGNESQIITNTKTFFTNRKYKNIKYCVNEDSITNKQLFTETNVDEDYDSMSKLNNIPKELETSEEIRNDSKESFDINFSITESQLDSILSITNNDNHIVSTDVSSENTTSTHCKSQNTEQFYDSISYTLSDSFEESLPSTIYSDDSNSANDIWCVEDYSDLSFINSTTSDNLNKAFIGE